MTTSTLLLELIKHSFFIKSTTTRRYSEGDARQVLYDSIDEFRFSVMRMLDQLAFWVIHTGIGREPARFGISSEVIDNVLSSDGTVGITALNVESVVGMRQYLQPNDLVRHLPVYLSAPPPTVHARRLARKHVAKDEIDKTIDAAARMEKEARAATHIPFVFIRNDPNVRVVALEIVGALERRRNTHNV